MKKIQSAKEAFELEGLNVDEIKIEGFPERHINAIKAIGKLMVINDHVNPKFPVDFDDHDQLKYEPWFYHQKGSPSGSGFRLDAVANYWADSDVSARLVSGSDAAARYMTTHPEFLELWNEFLIYKREVKK